jgi:hypothetical protein
MLKYGNHYYDTLMKDRASLSPEQRNAELKALDDWTAQLNLIPADLGIGALIDSSTWLSRKPLETRDAYSDRVASILLLSSLPPFQRADDSVRRDNERLEWTARVGVALAVFRLDHGEYPASLDALVPKYLPRLPDNTSPNPVAYERRDAGYVIRNVREYSTQEKSRMAYWKEDYDPDDIIIRTDQIPK